MTLGAMLERVELGSCGLLERGMNGVRRGKGARTTVPAKDGRRAGICWTVTSPQTLHPALPQPTPPHQHGRTPVGNCVILLVQDIKTRVLNAAAGELLHDPTLDPSRDYQPTGAPKGPCCKTPKRTTPDS
jgi:hypothetical protein